MRCCMFLRIRAAARTFPRLPLLRCTPSPPLLPAALKAVARQRRAWRHHQIGGLALQSSRELIEPCRRYADPRVFVSLDRAHLDAERPGKPSLRYTAMLTDLAQSLTGRRINMLFPHAPSPFIDRSTCY